MPVRARDAVDSYFPVQFVPTGNDSLIGLDVGSGQSLQQTIFQATYSKSLSVSPQIIVNLPSGTSQAYQYALPWPGLNSGLNNSREIIEGVFFGLIVVQPLIDDVVEATTRNVSVAIRILDATDRNNVIYTYPSGNTANDNTVGYYNIAFADRRWILQCSGRAPVLPGPYLAFVFSMLFFLTSALLTRCCMKKCAMRRDNGMLIENPRMSERQIDWMRSNAFSILNAIRDPLFIIDKEGYIIDSNDDAYVLTKYGTEDLIFGMHISKVFPGILAIKAKEIKKEKAQQPKLSHPPGPWASSYALENGAHHSGGASTPEMQQHGVPPHNHSADSVVVEIDKTYLEIPGITQGERERPAAVDKSTAELMPPGVAEAILRTKDGRELYVEANFSPIIDCQDGREKIQIIMFRDITSWRNQVRDAVEAKEAAELARNENTDYLSFATHELRNPLHVIVGLNGILMQSLSQTLKGLDLDSSGSKDSSSRDLTRSLSVASPQALSPQALSPALPPTSPGITRPLSPGLIGQPGGISSHSANTSHSEALDHLASISDATRVMRSILNDTRMLSKVESGTIEFQKTAFDLKDLLQRIYKSQMVYCETYKAQKFALDAENSATETVKNVSIQLELKGLEEEARIGSSENIAGLSSTDNATDTTSLKGWFPTNIKADPARLAQVLTSLINNAFEHTEKGSVTLRVIVENVRQVGEGPRSPASVSRKSRSRLDMNRPRAQVLVRFEVEDTGRGMPRSEMPKLFKSYAHGSVDRTLGSRSISLNVAYAMLALMGAELQAFSTVGQGTTIWFSLWFDVAEQSLPRTGSYEDMEDPDSALKPIGVVNPNMGIREARREISIPQEKEKLAVDDFDGAETLPGPVLRTTEPPSIGVTTGPTNQFESITGGSAPGNKEAKPQPRKGLEQRAQTSIRRSRSGADEPSSKEVLLRSNTTIGTAVTKQPSEEPQEQEKGNDAPKGESSKLPARKSTSASKTAKKPKTAARRLGTHPSKDRAIRVLVVEDNEVLLKIAGTTLARAGFEVQQAVNGEQAINKVLELGDKYFDVVLMDLLMPVMDGFQATEEIRRRGWTMPVIALTAKTLESDRLRCFKIGFNYFMTKPFQLGDIATVIRFMVGAEAEQQAQTPGEGPVQPTYGGPWSKFA
ncbi:uncharacterized protein EV422DRAFT_63043 [Fimicolochytrium jonesii]|uniref:uncharacterized protein n=1 Tax=Fimicolochytrium jonesii TaxID=1396493 RepID=UPI0022FEDEB5|nr:uncharacterized protein EV422DRAFT_63043 [Fimicolochytrium jonesii]KAI8820780.1 hypothetical protein EV422DRAFT_63043 [Fimicolochytrium jonesii]